MKDFFLLFFLTIPDYLFNIFALNVFIFIFNLDMCSNKHCTNCAISYFSCAAVLEMSPDLSSVYGIPEDATA